MQNVNMPFFQSRLIIYIVLFLPLSPSSNFLLRVILFFTRKTCFRKKDTAILTREGEGWVRDVFSVSGLNYKAPADEETLPLALTLALALRKHWHLVL